MDLKKLRHDLRNRLSPALLTADILSQHPDPDVRRQAETIIAAIESATVLLRTTTKS
ncbi:hypothetical protein [Brytella acorum]|uniref:Uncharacterized protein n=1 Tax=Brytella acorum TaxID=2959299 RepID=A0AA35V7Q3_9PROT|nr:hypothetical protein [Brytella acorum]MDF3625546.1 hypothetical protein [Brytella acorum]CAI9119413.1 hypothetical protein LMG32879_000228 [Brytella acorum]